MSLNRCCSILDTWAFKSASITITRTEEITLVACEGIRSCRSQATKTAVSGVRSQCDARRRVVGMGLTLFCFRNRSESHCFSSRLLVAELLPESIINQIEETSSSEKAAIFHTGTGIVYSNVTQDEIFYKTSTPDSTKKKEIQLR